MLQGAVVDDADVGLATRITPTAEAVEVPYSVVAEEGARFDRSAGTITRFKRGSRIVLSVPPVPNAEIYVELKDIKNVGPSKTVSERRFSLDSTPLRTERRVGRLAELGVHHLLGRSRVQARELEVTAVSLLLGEPLAARESGVSSPAACRPSPSVPQRVGTLTFESLKVLALPMAQYPARVDRLRAGAMRDISITTNEVSGTVSSDKPGILFLSIPYSSGWTAEVDGKPARVLRINTGFSGVAIGPGEHRSPCATSPQG